MNKTSKNEQGFTLVETILIILILCVIGGVGYMVHHNNHKTSTSATTNTYVTKAVTSKSTAAQLTDPTADWTSYTSTRGGYTLKYPNTWVTTGACPDGAGDNIGGLIMLAANSSSLGQCGTNNFGQITVIWQPVKAQCGLDHSDWTINSTDNVTVSGVSGLETNATSKEATTNGPAGTSNLQYCFITKGNMYVADYAELASYPNVLSDFNLMVTKTLTFN